MRDGKPATLAALTVTGASESCSALFLLLFTKCQHVTGGSHLPTGTFPNCSPPLRDLLPTTKSGLSLVLPHRPGQAVRGTEARGLGSHWIEQPDLDRQELRVHTSFQINKWGANHRASPSLLARLRALCQAVNCQGAQEKELYLRASRDNTAWTWMGAEKARSHGASTQRALSVRGGGVHRHRPSSRLNEQSPRGDRPAYCQLPKEHRGK